MKKIFGIIFLVLALLSAVNVISKLSRSGARATGVRAYDTGHKFGMVTAPILLGGMGLWLLLSARAHVVNQPPKISTRPKISGKLVLSIGFGIALIVVLLVAGQIFRRFGGSRSRGPAPAMNHAQAPRTHAAAGGKENALYSVGDTVEAHWAGKWIPGKITRTNPGGFNFMVQLEDARFPQPIVLSTNQLREKSR